MYDDIKNNLDSLNTKLDGIEKKFNAIETKASERRTGVIGAAPFARRGENIMSSRGFQFGKLIGAAGHGATIEAENAKIELDFAERFTKKCIASGYRPERAGAKLVPLDINLIPESMLSNDEYQEAKGLLANNVDADEMNSFFGRKSAVSPSMSWQYQDIGGSFVPPASFGPPIDLLRAHEVLLNAGATVVPLGPTGRMVMPRLVAPTQGGWAPENTAVTPVNPTTGQAELSAKKVIATVVQPGELLRFGSPATEQIIRNDLFKTVALIADKGYLEGPGSNTQPLGLATMGAAAGNPYQLAIITPTNPNQLAPQDLYKFFSGVEEQNGEITALLMRPALKWAWYESRWTPYSGGTSQGGFTFSFVRDAQDQMVPMLGGAKVVASTNISKTRGSGSQTYMLGINAPDIYVGLFGAIEFVTDSSGYTLLSSDQVAIRAILTTDMVARHPGQVAFCDSLNFVIAG